MYWLFEPSTVPLVRAVTAATRNDSPLPRVMFETTHPFCVKTIRDRRREEAGPDGPPGNFLFVTVPSFRFENLEALLVEAVAEQGLCPKQGPGNQRRCLELWWRKSGRLSSRHSCVSMVESSDAR